MGVDVSQYEKVGISTAVDGMLEGVVDRVKAALKDEGFGILTEINVQETLKEKLGVDVSPYVILGACNPALSHKALSANPAVGLMLPCNVVVEQRENGCIVSAMNPELMISAFGSRELQPVADDATARLKRAIAVIASS